MTAIILQSCLLDVLPWHSNIRAGKGFINFFDKCAARCVYMSPQEEECTSFFLGNSKIYTSGTTANSRVTPAEINKHSALAKIRISGTKKLKDI